MWLLAGFRSSRVIGLSAIFWWLLTQDLSQFSATYATGHSIAGGIHQSKWESKKEWARWKPVICNLIIEVTSYYFYFNLLFRTKLLCPPPHSKRGDCTSRKYQIVRIIGSHLRSCLPHITNLLFSVSITVYMNIINFLCSPR